MRVGMSLTVTIDPRLDALSGPSPLDVGLFICRLAGTLGSTATPDAISSLIEGSAPIEMASSDEVRTRVRDLLRYGGFKPAGRSKPASEYLTGAAAEGRFPRINALVDACNVVSLHSGLPISLVDLDLVEPPLSIAIAAAGTSYPFNPSGQVIDASGLVCLFDAQGPTGTPVKDAQRTKTHDGTRNAIVVVWGTRALPGRTEQATAWYRALCQTIPGAATEDVG
jgi:DNA/RNA-binding domain of Phe-tRNA-synthetase-like protein